MSHLRPLTVTWSSGAVAVGDNLEGWHMEQPPLSPVHQHCPLPPRLPSTVPGGLEGALGGLPHRGRSTLRACVPPPASRAGPALPSFSLLPLLCRGLWFGISFLRQLEPWQPPAWLLQILLGKTPQRGCRRAFQDQSHAPGDGTRPHCRQAPAEMASQLHHTPVCTTAPSPSSHPHGIFLGTLVTSNFTSLNVPRHLCLSWLAGTLSELRGPGFVHGGALNPQCHWH